jgi:hypothetical protein
MENGILKMEKSSHKDTKALRREEDDWRQCRRAFDAYWAQRPAMMTIGELWHAAWRAGRDAERMRDEGRMHRAEAHYPGARTADGIAAGAATMKRNEAGGAEPHVVPIAPWTSRKASAVTYSPTHLVTPQ